MTGDDRATMVPRETETTLMRAWPFSSLRETIRLPGVQYRGNASNGRKKGLGHYDGAIVPSSCERGQVWKEARRLTEELSTLRGIGMEFSKNLL